jgi:MFS family permease
MSFGQMSEFFFMLVMPLFFARLGVKWMLLVGMGAWVARYGLFAAAISGHVLWMAIIGIVLHGVCYDFFFVTGQIYVDKRATPQIRGQAQGFLVLVTQGIGMLIGAQVVGRIVAANTVGTAIDWQTVWKIPCIAAAVIMVIFFALFRDDSKAVPADVGDILLASPVEPAPAVD